MIETAEWDRTMELRWSKDGVLQQKWVRGHWFAVSDGPHGGSRAEFRMTGEQEWRDVPSEQAVAHHD